MEFKKEDLKEYAKKHGKELAEDALEMAAKRLAEMSLDMLEKFIDDETVDWKDMIWAASEDKLRELAEGIEVKL